MSRFTVNLNYPMMRLYYPIYNTQTQASSALFGGEKRCENSVYMLIGNTAAVVLYLHINTSSSNIIDIYMDSVDTRMDNIDNRIERMERVIQVKEETLIRQYSALYLQSAQLLQQPYSILGINFTTIA